MPDPEIEEVARFLATHAVLLLGLGVVAAALAVALLVRAVRVAARLRPAVETLLVPFIRRVASIEAVRRVGGRAVILVPDAYLALHLSLGLLVTIAVGFFVTLGADILSGGELSAFDVAFADALHDEQDGAWQHFFSFVSVLGTGYAVGIGTAVGTVILLVRQQNVLAFGWAASQAGGGLLNLALKGLFARSRPEYADPILAASSWSFPSGHAMGTFILCGVACYLLLRESRSLVTTSVVVTLAAMWSVVMAFSRLYLGVHFASDVIAGIVAGVAWVAVCVSAFEVLRRRTGPQPR
jgi:membrane-associated phospholipid phosphatase